jgi:hypothetical protein
MKLLAKIGLLGLCAGATGGVLYADPVGGWLSPNGVCTGASMTGTVDSTRAAGSMPTSLADLQVRVHALHEQTRADSRHVAYLQQIARKEKNVIKLNCVNDKLVQIKPQMNIADAAESELQMMDATRAISFETIAVAAESVHRLREEADQCIGETIVTGGESSNSFTGPQAPDDPTRGYSGNRLEPPSYASPFN